mmetsp:Transcript_41026/g.102662  ORF Transcript_41026/g.102662 Transcript_41026/m.102662 type:complete len:216 (-) Transcript_41026:890-1537(-)
MHQVVALRPKILDNVVMCKSRKQCNLLLKLPHILLVGASLRYHPVCEHHLLDHKKLPRIKVHPKIYLAVGTRTNQIAPLPPLHAADLPNLPRLEAPQRAQGNLQLRPLIACAPVASRPHHVRGSAPRCPRVHPSRRTTRCRALGRADRRRRRALRRVRPRVRTRRATGGRGLRACLRASPHSRRPCGAVKLLDSLDRRQLLRAFPPSPAAQPPRR